MVRLYLLGFTHDLKGVVFSQRRGGKAATFWIEVDDIFLDAIDKLERARQDAREVSRPKKGAKGKARPTRAEAAEARDRVVLPPVGRSQSTSAIPTAEIQQLLRMGRSVNAVVEAAKAPQAWVERLLEPVLTERVGVVRLAQRSQMTRPRLGRAGMPLGDAVIRNLEERRATSDTIEGLDDAWDARASRSGNWRIWVKFNHRGKRRTAEWEFRKDTRALTPRNRLAAQLGWWSPEPDAAPEPVEALGDGAEAQPSEESGAAPRRKPARRPAKRKRARKSAPKARARSAKAKPRPAKRSRRKTTPRRKAARRRP